MGLLLGGVIKYAIISDIHGNYPVLGLVIEDVLNHYLNEALLLNGGHIGDGVGPSERRKGVAAKSILNNGRVLENEVVVDGVIEQQYWITLD